MILGRSFNAAREKFLCRAKLPSLALALASRAFVLRQKLRHTLRVPVEMLLEGRR